MYRSVRVIFVFLVIALALSACGSPASQATATFTQPPSTPTPEPPPDPWGDVVVPAGESIRIAFIGNLSGPMPEIGSSLLNAANIAVADYGDIQGFTVQLIPVDDMCDDEQAQAAKDEVLSNPQIVGVVGLSCSSPAIVQLPFYESNKIPVIASAVTAPGLEAYAPSVWNTTILNDDQAKTAGDAFNVLDLPEYAVFTAAYETQTGEPVGEFGTLSAATYDAATLLLQAIDQTAWQNHDGALIVGRQAVVDQVRATSAYQGVSGYITMEENGLRKPPIAPDPWGDVVVKPGEKIQITFFSPTTEPYQIFSPAAKYAVENYGAIKGFEVNLNIVDDFCFESGVTTPAVEVSADQTNAGIVGPLCSPATLAALPYLEKAHMVMVSYGATRQDLNAYGKNTFNRVILTEAQRQAAGFDNDAYFFMEPDVQQFISEFTTWANIPIQEMAPDIWAFYPLAYDATGVLLTNIDKVAQIAPDGSLVIGRQALANAVRSTENYEGITGLISIDKRGNRTLP
jgi:ABC-type branched-subunit amino acid transport system substrate-binding protein